MAAASTFNVEAEIAKFVADPSRTDFRLPHLSTGQRKQARRVAEGHPGMRCQSFGFSADRYLHLFKGDGDAASGVLDALPTQSESEPQGTAETAKTPEGDEPVDFEATIAAFVADPTLSRLEMPHMSNSVRKQARRAADLHPDLICEGVGSGQDRRLLLIKACGGVRQTASSGWSYSLRLPATSDKPAERPNETSSNASTCASGRADGGSPALPEGLQVRNTFICGVTGEPADNRAVRSLPHGMFSRFLCQELQMQKTASMPAPHSTLAANHGLDAPAPARAEDELETGMEVIIHGLVRTPAFNGLRGTVQSQDEETGRYNILLFSPAGPNAQQWAKVRAENLEQVPVPQPPNFDASLAGYETGSGDESGFAGCGSASLSCTSTVATAL